MKSALLIFLLATGIPACVQFKQRHELEERASKAARALQNIYVLTPHQNLRIVYANAWAGNVCMEYLTDDARSQPIIRYAVLETNSKLIEYDLDWEDIEDRCSMNGLDLTDVADKELNRSAAGGFNTVLPERSSR